MKRIVLILAAAAAEVAFGFGFQSELTVGGYSGTETLVNFPVLVRLSPNSPEGFCYADLQANGADMEFRSPDGQTVYPHEIDTWNTSGESLVWVRVPALSGASTKILFRYGDVTKTERPDGASVWTGAADGFYAGVWHFGEEVDATAAAAAAVASDSAKHDPELVLDARPVKGVNGNFGQMTSAAGSVGNARMIGTVSKGNGNLLQVPDYSSFALGGTFTLSLWIHQNDATGYDKVVSRKTTDSDEGFYFGLDKGGVKAFVVGNTAAAASGTVPSAIGSWVHYVAVYNGTTGTCYANGAKVFEGTIVEVVDNNATLGIGGPRAASAFQGSFNGAVDECRLLSAPVSADWAKAEYETASDPSFVTATAVGPVPNVLMVTSSEGSVGTVSPAYGALEDLQDGQKVEFRAEAEQEATETLRHRFTGWTLYLLQNGEWVESVSGQGTSYDYIHTAGTTAKFVWNVVRQHPLTLAAEPADGCTFTVNGMAMSAGKAWIDEGRAAVEAVPAENYEVSRWTGDVSGQTTASISVDMTADAAKTATVVLDCNDPAHEPEDFLWVGPDGAAGADWFDPENWDLKKLPVAGDCVYLTNKWHRYINVEAPTPHLGKLVVAGVTLVCKGWDSRVRADEIVVKSNGKVSMPRVESANKPGVLFDDSAVTNRIWLSGGTLTVEAGGVIEASGGGFASHNGPCWAGIGTSDDVGGVHGGAYGGSPSGTPPQPYDSAEFPALPGCGSAAAGNKGGGGGVVKLDFTGAVTIDGAINADPIAGGGYSCGSGGSVWIVCSSISGAGSVNARGAQNPGGNVNGGGGGRIAVHYSPSVQSNVACSVVFSAMSLPYTRYPYKASGVQEGNHFGASEDGLYMNQPGTVWFSDNQFLTLPKHAASGWRSAGVWTTPEPLTALSLPAGTVIDSAQLVLPYPGLVVTVEGDLTVTADSGTYYSRRINGVFFENASIHVKGDLVVAGARFGMNGGSLKVDGDVVLKENDWKYWNGWSDGSGVAWAYAGGELEVTAADADGAGEAGATVEIAGALTMMANSVLRPASSPNGSSVRFSMQDCVIAEKAIVNAECAGYAWGKGPGTGTPATHTYGNARKPTEAGSGGSATYTHYGMPGGGVVWFDVERRLTLDGTICADGNRHKAAQYAHASSGGSVYLRAGTFGGTGTITARGGFGSVNNAGWGTYHKNGGGGRIAVWVTENLWSVAERESHVSVEGGYEGALPGSVLWLHRPGGLILFVR